MKWEQLLSSKRNREFGGRSKAADLRSEFEKDYHRIIGSASFRRLQDKTQVFPLDKSDFIRTRLTHSTITSTSQRTFFGSVFFWEIVGTEYWRIDFGISERFGFYAEDEGRDM